MWQTVMISRLLDCTAWKAFGDQLQCKFNTECCSCVFPMSYARSYKEIQKSSYWQLAVILQQQVKGHWSGPLPLHAHKRHAISHISAHTFLRPPHNPEPLFTISHSIKPWIIQSRWNWFLDSLIANQNETSGPVHSLGAIFDNQIFMEKWNVSRSLLLLAD